MQSDSFKNQFQNLYSQQNLLAQPLDVHNLVRRVAYQLLYAVASIEKLAPNPDNDSSNLLGQTTTGNPNADQRLVLKFYNNAKNVYPFDGKVFAELGQHTLMQDDLQKCHYLMRALSCAHPEASAKEDLINLLESCRIQDIEFRKKTNLHQIDKQIKQHQTKTEQLFAMFFCSLMRQIGILYTKIGADELDGAAERTKALFKLFLDEYMKDQAQDSSGQIDVETVTNLLHVSLILIFTAHATISDFQTSKTGGLALNEIFDSQLPKASLTLIKDFFFAVSDRITPCNLMSNQQKSLNTNVPSAYQICLTPLLCWFAQHKDDGLFNALSTKNFKQELSRLQSMLSDFIEKMNVKLWKQANVPIVRVQNQQISGGVVGNNKNPIIVEDFQIEILELAGNSMMFEERFCFGFLPLQSYFDTFKKIGSGQKCPSEKEDQVRCIIQRDCLQSLGCYGKEKIGEENKENNQKYDAFAQLDSLQLAGDSLAQSNASSFTTNPISKKPLVVLDVQNIAMRHGQDKIFSCQGIELAIRFWQGNGHQVVGFLPEYLFNHDQVGQNKRLTQMGLKQVKVSKMPNSVASLIRLEKAGHLIKTPAQDYDDSYCLDYARRCNAYIVSNDKFRDYLQKIEVNPEQNSAEQLKQARQWIQTRVISFAFKADEHLPNPDCNLFKKYPIQSYKQYKVTDQD